jgi:hypothetical protein
LLSAIEPGLARRTDHKWTPVKFAESARRGGSFGVASEVLNWLRAAQRFPLLHVVRVVDRPTDTLDQLRGVVSALHGRGCDRSSRVIAPSRSEPDSLITMILGMTVFLSARWRPGTRAAQHREQIPHRVILDERMAHGTPRHDLVAVSSALSLAQHVTPFDQLGQDPVRGALGDAHRCRDVAQPDARVVSHAHEDMGVICQKIPTGHRSG